MCRILLYMAMVECAARSRKAPGSSVIDHLNVVQQQYVAESLHFNLFSLHFPFLCSFYVTLFNYFTYIHGTITITIANIITSFSCIFLSKNLFKYACMHVLLLWFMCALSSSSSSSSFSDHS